MEHLFLKVKGDVMGMGGPRGPELDFTAVLYFCLDVLLAGREGRWRTQPQHILFMCSFFPLVIFVT